MSNFQNLKAMWENKAKQNSNTQPPLIVKPPQKIISHKKEQPIKKEQSKPIVNTEQNQENNFKKQTQNRQQKKEIVNEPVSMLLDDENQKRQSKEVRVNNKTVGDLKNQFEHVLKFSTTPQMVSKSKQNAPPDNQLEFHTIRNPKDIKPIEGRQRDPSFSQKKAMIQKMYQNRETHPGYSGTLPHRSFIPKQQIKSTIPVPLQHYQTGQITQNIQMRKPPPVPKITFLPPTQNPIQPSQFLQNHNSKNSEVLIENRAKFIVNNVFPNQKLESFPSRPYTLNNNNQFISSSEQQTIVNNPNTYQHMPTRHKKAERKLGNFQDS